MACRELKATIGKHDIFARQWGATQALNMQVKLLNNCGALVIPFIEGTYDFDNVLQLMAGVKHEVLVPTVKQFLSCVRIEGQAVDEANFDTHFDGNLIDMICIFGAVCELQYKDFFVQGRARLPRRK